MKKRILTIALVAALCLTLAAPALALDQHFIFGDGTESVWLKDVLTAGEYAALKAGASVAFSGPIKGDLEKGILYILDNGAAEIKIYDSAGNLTLTIYLSITGTTPPGIGEEGPCCDGYCNECYCGEGCECVPY